MINLSDKNIDKAAYWEYKGDTSVPLTWVGFYNYKIMVPNRKHGTGIMEEKYKKGDRVRIVWIRNEQGFSKYPHLEKYIGQSGEIIDTYAPKIEIMVAEQGVKETTFPFYRIRLDNFKEIEAEEDALVASE